MATELHVSADGAQWTPATGLQLGLTPVGVIRPSANDSGDNDRVYDCIVIGAGYTGLVAARDLTKKNGVDTLLVEARDRIGGRTWSSTIEGHQYDLGGKWLHWNQPFVWRELAHFGMTEALEISPARGYGLDSTSVVHPDGASTMSHAKEVRTLDRVSEAFDLEPGADMSVAICAPELGVSQACQCRWTVWPRVDAFSSPRFHRCWSRQVRQDVHC